MASPTVGNASLELFGQRAEVRLSFAAPLFALILLIVIWGATFHFIRLEHDHTIRAVDESLEDMIDTYEAQIARNVGGIEQTLKTINYAVQVNGIQNALTAMKNEDLLPPPIVFAISIIDNEGKVVDANPPVSVGTLSAEKFFTHHLQDSSDKVFVSSALKSAKAHAPVQFSKRLTDSAGQFIGVAMLTVDPGYFTSGYEPSRLGAHGMLALSSQDGAVLALRNGESAPLAAGPDGIERYTATRLIGRLHLNASVGLAKSEQLSDFHARRNTSLLQAGAATLVVLAMLAGFWAWNRQGAKTRRSIRLAQQTYEAASESNQDAFFVLHSVVDHANTITDFRISAANRQAELLTGVDRHHLRNGLLSKLLPEAFSNGIFENLTRAATLGGVHQKEIKNRIDSFKGVWFHEQLIGVEGGVIAIVRDISERKAAEAKILHMAQHDALTGLPNRALLQSRIESALVHASRRDSVVVVAFVDLDNFKMVNDGLGHGAGDLLLAEIAARMREGLRRQDTVGRFGGDEFVIVLPARRSQLDQCIGMLEGVTAAVRRTVDIEGHAVEISCSIGVAVYPQDGSTAASLLTRADVAMYSAKASGKNQSRFYSDSMNTHAEKKLAMVESLRTAVKENQFCVVYQPKFDVRTGAMFGVEALVRWHHPTQGQISPAEFIPLAEESGVIVDIGRWVMQTACAQSMAWQRLGLPPLIMSVNVSPRQFDDADLLTDIASTLLRTGLPPETLELEITESLIMRDLDGAVATMRELQQMGLLLSIDDFGTGYSSLSSLKSFPITTLKIDQSFVRDLGANTDDQAIARAIIAMAHELRLRVIAEGVETQAQFDFLRANGCDEVQGYLFARPASPDVIESMLQAPAQAA